MVLPCQNKTVILYGCFLCDRNFRGPRRKFASRKKVYRPTPKIGGKGVDVLKHFFILHWSQIDISLVVMRPTSVLVGGRPRARPLDDEASKTKRSGQNCRNYMLQQTVLGTTRGPLGITRRSQVSIRPPQPKIDILRQRNVDFTYYLFTHHYSFP